MTTDLNLVQTSDAQAAADLAAPVLHRVTATTRTLEVIANALSASRADAVARNDRGDVDEFTGALATVMAWLGQADDTGLTACDLDGCRDECAVHADDCDGFCDHTSGRNACLPPVVAQAADDLTGRALDAFWSVVAAAHPTATTGDLDPGQAVQLSLAADSAIRAWVDGNVPGAADDELGADE